MNDIYNFSAGPACLSEKALTGAKDVLFNYQSSGISLLEMSHRSPQIVNLFEETTINLKNLLNVPDNYHVLWLQGGASLQFSMVPMNLLPDSSSADYIDTGVWSAKAILECEKIGNVNVVGSSRDSNYTFIPKNIKNNNRSSYLHITSNNTIYGTQYKAYPEVNNENSVLVADMSSDILSGPINVSDFGLIYAGAQKNMGPAGTTLVIVKKSILGKTGREIPTMLDYNTHINKDSMFNTPPVFAIYVSMLTLEWLKDLGGIKNIEKRNKEKANLLYDEIDRNSLFRGTANKEDRSNMNITFLLNNDDKKDLFNMMCEKAGINGINGHRSVGGYRASIYNAMPLSSVKVLVDLMKELENK